MKTMICHLIGIKQNQVTRFPFIYILTFFFFHMRFCTLNIMFRGFVCRYMICLQIHCFIISPTFYKASTFYSIRPCQLVQTCIQCQSYSSTKSTNKSQMAIVSSHNIDQRGLSLNINMHSAWILKEELTVSIHISPKGLVIIQSIK